MSVIGKVIGGGGGGGGGGTTDHGALTGLGDDDHLQYQTAARVSAQIASEAIASTRTINTTGPLTGGGDLSADRTISITPATTTNAGSMSATDKAKLDGIATGATNTTLSTSLPQGLGTPAAGSTGQVSDAGHVHAMPTAAQVGAATAADVSASMTTHLAAVNPHGVTAAGIGAVATSSPLTISGTQTPGYVPVITSAGAAAWAPQSVGGGVTAHSALTGLGANDHPQYALAADVATQMAAKADAAATTAALASKADTTALANGLATKADAAATAMSLSAKADAWLSVAFSSALPLDGRKVLAQYNMSGPLTLSVGPASLMGECYARIVGDGTNTPVFSGLLEHGASSGYVSSAGTLNILSAWHDGTNSWYSWSQPLLPIDLLAPSLLHAKSSPGSSAITAIMSESLNASFGAAAAWSVSASGGACSILSAVVSGSSVTLSTSRPLLGSEIISISYSQPGSGGVRDVSGNLLASFTSVPVTNFLRFLAMTHATETGAAPAYVYSGDGTGWPGAYAESPNFTLPAGADGWFQARLAARTTPGPFISYKNTSASGSWNTAGTNGLYSDGSVYTRVTNGSVGAINGTSVAPGIGDLVRLERSAGALSVKVSKDSGSTWTVVHSFGAVSGQLWPHLGFSGSSSSWDSLSFSGLT